MVTTKHLARTSFLLLVGLALLTGLIVAHPGEVQPVVKAAGCWKAEITSQHTDLDLAGSVLRVAVEGMGGLPVRVRSQGGFETLGATGTKPEYGPNVAEFAPLSRGTYFIEPQGLGIAFQIWLDGKSYVRVDFRAADCAPATATGTRAPTLTPTATRTPAPTVTSTRLLAPPTAQPAAQPAAGWRGRIVQHDERLAGRYYGTIAVRVIGRPAGQEVAIESGAWSATCKTGTKPEHGPDACDLGVFAGLGVAAA